jgi:hypothetical protein
LRAVIINLGKKHPFLPIAILGCLDVSKERGDSELIQGWHFAREEKLASQTVLDNNESGIKII